MGTQPTSHIWNKYMTRRDNSENTNRKPVSWVNPFISVAPFINKEANELGIPRKILILTVKQNSQNRINSEKQQKIIRTGNSSSLIRKFDFRSAAVFGAAESRGPVSVRSGALQARMTRARFPAFFEIFNKQISNLTKNLINQCNHNDVNDKSHLRDYEWSAYPFQILSHDSNYIQSIEKRQKLQKSS